MDKKANDKKNLIAICASIIAVIIIIVVVVLAINRGPNQLGNNFFTSDDTKLVIPLDGDRITSDSEEPLPEKTYLVYYYAGDTITKYQTFQKYSNEEDAKKALVYFQDTVADLFEEISRDGDYIIITHEADDYNWITAEDVRQQIEYNNGVEQIQTENTEESTETVEEEVIDETVVDETPIDEEPATETTETAEE